MRTTKAAFYIVYIYNNKLIIVNKIAVEKSMSGMCLQLFLCMGHTLRNKFHFMVLYYFKVINILRPKVVVNFNMLLGVRKK